MNNFYQGFVKLIMLMCIALQSVAMTPHHHHVDSLAFCIDCVHLCESTSCDDSDHDTVPGDHEPISCSPLEMLLTVQELSVFKSQISCTDHHMHCAHCTCLPCNVQTAALLDDSKASIIICGNNYSYVSSLYVTHVLSTIPPRAPDFLS